MAMNVNNDGAYASEINVTPLVDVVLVLLIIFMMIGMCMCVFRHNQFFIIIFL